MERHSERLGSPNDGLGIERLTDARYEPELRQVKSLGDAGAHFHQHADGGRRGVPNRDFLVLQDAVPPFGVKLGLIDDQRGAVGERRDDAVGHSGHPSRIGRAPEHVIRMQIERELAGDMMSDDGLMHVHGAFRSPGGAACEMQQRHVCWSRPYRVERVGCLRQGVRKIDCAGGRIVGTVGQKDMLQARKLVAPRLHFAPVECLGCDQDFRGPDGHSRLDRLRPERRKQRGEDAARFERAKRCDVKLGYTAQ